MINFTPSHYFTDDKDGNIVQVMFVKVQGVECARTMKVDSNGNKLSIISTRQLHSNGSEKKSKLYFVYRDRRIYFTECRRI